MDLKQFHNKQIRILNKKYTLKLKKRIKTDDSLLGQTVHHKNVIELSTEQDLTSFTDTLLHEILHAIWYTSGIEYGMGGEQTEEFVVNSFSSALINVFIDNKWLLELFHDVISEEWSE